MIVTLIIAVILFALMFPEASIGKFAKRHFVDAPAEWLNSLNPVKMLALIIVAIIILVCSTAFPPGMAFIAAGDLTAYVEIVAALVMVVARLRITYVATAVRRVMSDVTLRSLLFIRTAQNRVRRMRRFFKPSANDEDEGPALMAA